MLPTNLSFDLPATFLWGLPLVLALLGATAIGLAAVRPRRRWALLALRALALLTLVTLLARPVAVERHDPEERRSVILLADRSRSMSLVESGATRFEQLNAMASQLASAIEARGLKVEGYLFAEDAFPGDPQHGNVIDGRRTDLGGAVVHALKSAEKPPLAVVALTDGVANVAAHNRSALLGLVDRGVPFVGIGIGDDDGVLSLALERLTAPASVPPEETFKLTAHMQTVGAGEVPAFDLLLLRRSLQRDEDRPSELVQVRRVAASQGSRIWTESFELVEDEEGLYDYTVEVQAPVSNELVTVSTRASAPVNVTASKTLRVLFVQGALTWNFKFIGRALRSDPAITLTGLSRTSERSIFRQNVESAGELLDGFPDELAELAPYRVVILSDLGPSEMTPAQQEAVARFVGELGGGLLMLGGPLTFNARWQGTRLEELLPVTFDPDPDVGLDRPFHLQLTDEALRHPVFQVESGGKSLGVWESLPTFTQYGRVADTKAGAIVWARHSHDAGPNGRRVLMASQYYGAGLSAVISVPSLWRWRLAKESDPVHFDRFWKQLLRYLGQSGSQEVSVQFVDQDQSPGVEIRALVERRPRPDPNNSDSDNSDERTYTVKVTGPSHAEILVQEVDLRPLRPVEVTFPAAAEGVYAVRVFDDSEVQVASRPLEIRDVDVEMERTGRDLANLRQWAGLSQGLATAIEDGRDVDALVDDVLARAEALQRTRDKRIPLGIDGWGLLALLACLGAEWALRKRWVLP